MWLKLCNADNYAWGKNAWLSVVDSSMFVSTFSRDEDSRPSRKKVTFNFSGDEDSEGEDMEDIFGGKTAKSESKSSFEKRQEKVNGLC